MPRPNARTRANLNIYRSKANKRLCSEPDSNEVPDIDFQHNVDFCYSDLACLICAEREQKTFVCSGTQTIESYKNSTHLDWFLFYY